MTEGRIRAGIGGWTFEPWRGAFYPEGLKQKDELAYASARLGTIEINGTYYSSFKPDSFRKWADTAPDGFVYAVKASRFCTNRKRLADGAGSIDRFLNQGLTELGPKLGPILWQFMATKAFDAEDFAAFLALLPDSVDGVPLRHALEVRHQSFDDPAFYALAQRANAAIVFADHDAHPRIDEPTADFTYARLMRTQEGVATGYDAPSLDAWAQKARDWSARGDVFVYFISGDKVRNPAAAMALAERTVK
ncbi:MAG: DUF72 domain-containing protein [Sphingobium sp.]|jgi:uncharacterized protein YecE (DUF72 family)|nr:MAG: DUF72 domain-containing protein [Sphingobium sp.]